MRKTLISVLCIIIITTLLFSGCAPLSFLKKEEAAVTTTQESTESAVPVTEPFSEYLTEISTEIALNTNTDTTAQSTTVTPTTTVPAATPAASRSDTVNVTAVTETKKAAAANTKKQQKQKSKKPAVTQKTTEPETRIPEKDLENLSVKEIQDLLFETEDPNIAGKILTLAGFEYDAEQGIYYSQIDPLQRLFGFNVIYDLVAPRTGMIYSTKRIYFNYDGKDWMVQIWKGQYGITAGAEIGLYNKPENRLIEQYDCAKDDELITMAFDFYNGGKYEFSRGPEKHWWLTGFKILHLGIGPLIDLKITLEFPKRAMSDAFEKGLKQKSSTSLADKLTYVRKGNTFKIEW